MKLLLVPTLCFPFVTDTNKHHSCLYWSRRDFVVASLAAGGSGTAPTVSRNREAYYNSNNTQRVESSIDDAPFRTVRRYKTITLKNGLSVILVSDSIAVRSSAALTVADAGQLADPIPGLAHLMEHLILSNSIDFEAWLSERDGASNAFTAYDKVCFHFSCPTIWFAEALERFARLFQWRPIRTEALRREVRRVDAELDWNDPNSQLSYLTRAFCDHPYARFSAGSLETLEKQPQRAGIQIKQLLQDFFESRYLAQKTILVVVGPTDLVQLERWVAPFSNAMSLGFASPRLYPGSLLMGNRLKQMILYNKQASEKLTFDWALNYASGSTATHICFCLAQLLCRRGGPGSLYWFLLQRGWLRGVPKMVVPLDVAGFQIIRLEIPLTVDGLLNRSATVAAVYDALSAAMFSRALLRQYATVAKLHGYIMAQRAPDAVELAVDAQVYGLDAVSSGQWYRFPQDVSGLSLLQRHLTESLDRMSDPENAVIVAMAGNRTVLESGFFAQGLPPLSSKKWLIEPVSGARFCFDDMQRLSARLEELVLTKIIDEDEIQRPSLNPLVPTSLRPSRIDNDFLRWRMNANERLVYPTVSQGTELFRLMTAGGSGAMEPWVVLPPPMGQTGLPLPPSAPEPSCRSAFCLQLLSSHLARANIRQAAYAELWKLSLEHSLEDLIELGVPGGFAYDVSFNKFGVRLCFLGPSQTLPSYTRRFCRRLAEHHLTLLNGPRQLPLSVTTAAVFTASRAPGLNPQRRRRIRSNLRSANAYDTAAEGLALLRSVKSAVCFAQGDLLNVQALLQDLHTIFEPVIMASASTSGQVAVPLVSDLVYPPYWKPRPCSVAGASLLCDACGRVPR